MANYSVKKGDTVEILVGDEKEKGKRGKVLLVSSNGKVIVEGLNIVKRHTRPRKAQEKGGIVDKPRPIDISNVSVVCPTCKKAVRVGHTLSADGKKFVRTCKKCGAILDVKQEKATKKATKKKAVKELKEEINKEE